MPKRNIDEVVIIYNPNSTGDGAKNARRLRTQLKERSFDKTVRLMATKYAGHAEKIAESYANKSQVTLLISSSGDGGYHELINGILKGKKHNVVAGLLPSGNANDHFSAIGNPSVVDDILKQLTRKVDVLKLEGSVNGEAWVRYAHSYIGAGVSPVVGKELNKTKLNFFNEKLILARELFSFHNTQIVIRGRRVRIISIIFANIPTMSKVLKVAQHSAVDDGKFEINMMEAEGKLRMLLRLFKASTVGLEEDRSASQFGFKTIKRTPVQLDGEVFTLDADSDVTVSVAARALDVII